MRVLCVLQFVYILLYQPVDLTDVWFWIHILVQTWLFTGLFITGHDSMHGTISRNRGLNNFLGFLATTLYAGLWYPTGLLIVAAVIGLLFLPEVRDRPLDS